MKITKIFQALTLAFAALYAAGVCYGQPVARVNGVAIPQNRVEQLVKNAVAQGQTDSPELRNRIRDVLINQEIMTQEAVKKGLDKNSEVSTQIEINKQQVLINAYLRDYFKVNPITEDTVKKEYEAAKARMGNREVKARHILVKQEDEAKQIIAQLKKNTNFEKTAAEKSTDSGSKGTGGDLGWINPNTAPMVPSFLDALKKLKKGQLTDVPVQSQFGWHVIRVDDERPATAPPFEEASNAIRQQLQNQAVQKAVADLRAKAKIE